MLHFQTAETHTSLPWLPYSIYPVHGDRHGEHAVPGADPDNPLPDVDVEGEGLHVVLQPLRDRVRTRCCCCRWNSPFAQRQSPRSHRECGLPPSLLVSLVQQLRIPNRRDASTASAPLSSPPLSTAGLPLVALVDRVEMGLVKL